MPYPIKCFGGKLSKKTIKKNVSHFQARIGVKSIENIMDNRNERMHTESPGRNSDW